MMPISEIVADTPYYVLLDGNHRIGPSIVQLDAGNRVLANLWIFGQRYL